MSLEPATIRILRETLEERLPRNVAAAILFEALADWGPRVPSARTELADIVRGSLREALLRRIPSADAYGLLRRIEQLLITAEAPTGKHGRVTEDEARALFPEEERSTNQLPSLDGAARVMVLSATEELAINLNVCVEGYALVVRNAATMRDINAAATSPPDLVIVDCKLPTAIDSRVVVSALRGFGPSVLCIVWGIDLPLGANLVAALEGAELRVVPIALSSGVAPVLDLLLSRAPVRARKRTER